MVFLSPAALYKMNEVLKIDDLSAAGAKKITLSGGTCCRDWEYLLNREKYWGYLLVGVPVTIKATPHIEVPGGVRPNFPSISHELWSESIPPGCPLNGRQNIPFSYGLGHRVSGKNAKPGHPK